MMTLRHITAAEMRNQHREREIKREQEGEGKEPQPKKREKETGISSMIEFDIATSRFLTLLINK